MAIVLPQPDWIIGKHGLMNLRAMRRNGRTEIDPHSWRIPYQWQGGHYQDNDDQPFLLLINSGGGFVEGDVAELHATLDAGTRTLITTTAASKFYKCPDGATSRELVDIRVGPDALLEYYPDESIPFARSRVERRTRIELHDSSRLFATDMIAAGRIHYGAGEAFAFDELFSEFEVVAKGRPLLTDRLVCEGEEVAALARLWDGATHAATVVIHAPDLPKGLEEEIELQLSGPAVVASGASRSGNAIVCRILATEAWACHEAIFRCWAAARPTLAAKAARPIRKC
ncbi:urease accessory protein UreD [Hansschlegelia plantiphila]|uniref:Urease accessory protein UreD n=1 Tax=Hansschlegelia plantiphila TaxID=374655 RepID=A0A9W6MUK7_9HYPH|nr:urease accessory protein UreD [Hansschlegelia plantiphila]GLK66926.1 urease accessory protein UreD 2 [Hansschlegelia plantiphila]